MFSTFFKNLKCFILNCYSLSVRIFVEKGTQNSTLIANSIIFFFRLITDLSSDSYSMDLYNGSGHSLGGSNGSHQRTKRMRTSFKHHQLRTMKTYFTVNHNPDAKDLKQLSQKTGLAKRVLQVSVFLLARLFFRFHFFFSICLIPSGVVITNRFYEWRRGYRKSSFFQYQLLLCSYNFWISFRKSNNLILIYSSTLPDWLLIIFPPPFLIYLFDFFSKAVKNLLHEMRQEIQFDCRLFSQWVSVEGSWKRFLTRSPVKRFMKRGSPSMSFSHIW